jgi:hypothetical protein
MIEIIITLVIVFFAGFIIVKSLKNSSKGECNCGCSGCKAEKACSEKNKINIK